MATFVETFYGRLVKDNPELAPFFKDANATGLNAMVAKIFATAIDGDQTDRAQADLADLSRGHKTYGVMPGFLPPFGRAFLATIREALPEDTDPSTLEAWELLYANTAAMMMKAWR